MFITLLTFKYIDMRKMNAVFMLILMVSLFVGCSSDDTDEKQGKLSIVGTWVTDDDDEIHTVIFKSDNTGEFFVTFEGEKENFYSFTYLFDGKNTLKISTDGKTETAIISLTDKKLIIGELVYFKAK